MPEGVFYVRDFMTDRVVAVEADHTVAEALSRMEQEGVHELPVMKGSGLKGWISYTTLVRRGGVSPQTKLAHVMEQPPRIQKDAPLFDAAELMMRNNVRALPVVNPKGQVVGILSRTDILAAAAQIPAISGLALDAVMNPELETCREEDLVDQVLPRLRHLHVNQLLILSGNGRLKGYVALEELLKARMDEHAPQSAARARKDMGRDGDSREARVEVKGFVKDAPTLAPTAKLRDAIKLMQKTHLNFVVVVEKDAPVGVVSRSNIVERFWALKPSTGVVCQITGLSDRQAEFEPIYHLAQHSLKKVSTEVKPEFLNLHYKIYKAKEGGDSKYALSAHLGMDGRFMVQKADAWDALEATRLALEGIEQRILELKELRLDRRKISRRKTTFYEAAPA